MREYLKKLIKGEFIYDDVKLVLADECLHIQAVCGTFYEGSFTIEATKAVKGIVWSDNERVVVKTHTFAGTAACIEFEADTHGLSVGDELTGHFDIVSNAGEVSLEYAIKVVPAVYYTSGGQAISSYNFAGLVQSAREEAIAVFDSDIFGDAVIGQDTFLANMYDVLKNGASKENAVEEYLVAAKKKTPVTIGVNETAKVYDIGQESISETIEIIKSGWGDVNIYVSSDSDMVKPELEHITADYFTGNHYELHFMVDATAMHAGSNYGRLTLKTFNQTILIDIKATKPESERNLYEKRVADIGLVKEYLSYRMKKTDKISWINNSGQIIDRVRGFDNDSIYYKLLKAQMCYTGQQHKEGEWLLESVRRTIGSPDTYTTVKEAELYGYYLYVSSLALKDEGYTAKAAAVVRNYYENGCDTWRMLWLLFYLDSSINRNLSIKLLRIKDVCIAGCTSPVMYIEALSIMNAQPSLLRVLNSFEIRVLTFGCKYGIISDKLAMQAVGIIEGEKHVSPDVICLLSKINMFFDNDTVLRCLLTQMIRGSMTGGCNSLYEKGILRGLRITRLYEYYIKSLDKSRMNRLPQMVLRYFAYDSMLDYRDKAYLYANVIVNEYDTTDIYEAYSPAIEHFAYEQLKKGNIDDNLCIIYKHIWSEKLIDDSTYDNMRRLLFTYKVTSLDTDIQAVYVKHKETDEICCYKAQNNIAYIQVYTDNAAIVLKDRHGEYHNGTVKYEVTKLIEDDRLLKIINERYTPDAMIMAYMFESKLKSGSNSDETYALALSLMKQTMINMATKRRCNTYLIDYYKQYYTGDDLNRCIGGLITDALMLEDAVKLIDICITSECYEKSVELIAVYGYSKVVPVNILKLIEYMVDKDTYGENQCLTGMCLYVFNSKVYTETVLKYLSCYYNGSNEQMYEIYKACKNFKIECQSLAERIVAQMLFTGEHNGRMTEVFGSYCEHGGRQEVISAYVSYHSFLFFLKQKKTNDIVFRVLEQLIAKNEPLPDICRLSLLKYYSAKTDALSAEQKALAQSVLNDLCKEDKIFNYYRRFAGILEIPYNAADKTVIEYIDNPECRVRIHYSINGEAQEHVEVLTNTAGVFTKTLTLFYGDVVQYYIKSEHDGVVRQSEPGSISNTNINPRGTSGRFEYINDMLASRELHDIVTMKKLMHGYIVQDYVAKELFTKID